MMPAKMTTMMQMMLMMMMTTMVVAEQHLPTAVTDRDGRASRIGRVVGER